MIEKQQQASQKIGLVVNITKTKILSTQNIRISIKEKEIENVDEYVYLGLKFKIDKENQETEIPLRMGQSWAVFKKLNEYTYEPKKGNIL